MGPELAVGDGALGFWKALRQVYGIAREQRCWVHKTGNVLNKLPKGLQNKAKQHLQDIWMAETRKAAESTFATVRLRTYRTKGCMSRRTALAMVFKLCQSAQGKWRKLNGSDQLAEIIRGVRFVDGEPQDRAAA